MSINRPDPKSVSPQYVAQIAQQRAGEQYQDIILRDAKIQEQQQYITALETRLNELEQQPAPIAAPTVAGPRAARPRHEGEPAEQQAG